ncbi:hypothetical protein ANCDUO_12094 [Ancylostoma duodenale]|uniref:Uncharacterized protein n=1 Tax=Ancylostoma duodenale TaxID=51022 RepID=A0A0C2CM89_9BILA|nr:hypothetical protein ANCDUO_12094 [Ancylostoma duodenale]
MEKITEDYRYGKNTGAGEQLGQSTAKQHREYDITKRRIEKILKAGANVVLTTGGMLNLPFVLCVVRVVLV